MTQQSNRNTHLHTHTHTHSHRCCIQSQHLANILCTNANKCITNTSMLIGTAHTPTHPLTHSLTHTHTHTLTRQNTVHAALSSAANIIRHPLARSKDLKPKRPMRSQQPQSLQQLFTQPIPQQGGWGHSMTTHSLTQCRKE